MDSEGEPRKPNHLVKQFLERKAPEMHEAFGIASSFNDEKSEFEVEVAHREYLETLRKYETDIDETLDFDPVDCPWAKVMDEMNKAQQAAERSRERDKGIFTKNRRKLARISPIVVGALEAIPDELSILHGGLAVIFHLALRREKNRQNILDSFETIPVVINMARSKSKNFPGNAELGESVDNLRRVLLVAIPNLVELLQPGTFLAKFRSPFQELDIDNLLEVVRRSADQVEACADDLRDGLIVKTHRLTEGIETSASRIEEGIASVGKDMDGHFVGADSRMLELIQGQQLMVQQVTDALSSQNGMFQMLKDAVIKHLCEQDLNFTVGRGPPVKPASEAPSQYHLLSNLLGNIHVPTEQETHDLTTILRRTRASESAAKPEATAILQSSQFQAWMGSHGSGMLLVDGHLDPSMLTKTSPISFFCANLVQVLRGIGQVATLHFFCSQHVASNDGLCGPHGLARSLLAQLAKTVVQYGAGSLSSLEEFTGIDAGAPIEAFCDAMLLLLGQMPSQVAVFCIIDDIHRFEREDWLEEFTALMGALSSLVLDPNARFRLLITSATKSKWLQGKVASTQHLELRGAGREMGRAAERSRWTSALGNLWQGS